MQFVDKDLSLGNARNRPIVATSQTEAESLNVALQNAVDKCWVQIIVGLCFSNFMNTKIHIDNESTISIVKNPVYHSKTKHIEIRHHFIRDCYEKKLINVEKIHTDLNVADLVAEIVLSSSSNLRYAVNYLNPTIYDSLVKQFWQSAIASTKEDGFFEISATIDNIRGFQGAPRPLLPSMLLVATNPIAGQEHAAQAQSQPLPPPPPIPSPTPTPIPTTTSPTPPPIPTTTSPTPPPIPTPTSPPPPPPPETEPPTDEHIYEEQSPVHHHFSPSQAQAPSHLALQMN
ncbi:hypothetical protein Tco_0727300 [Tanacetum coccineum]|uniref:Uncharacterized protein n=1 Tax=Tanacetum coccineum TaxID=301880 RepID=A0ABQ4YI02_9ASTR